MMRVVVTCPLADKVFQPSCEIITECFQISGIDCCTPIDRSMLPGGVLKLDFYLMHVTVIRREIDASMRNCVS